MSNYRRYFLKNFPVFITMVSNHRQKLFVKNIKILRKAFRNAKSYYDFKIIAITVMQDHVHLILEMSTPEDLPKIIRLIKIYFSTNISEQINDKYISESMKRRGEKGIWQRRYYDHIIRNEDDLWTHIDYIHFNSMKHYNISPKNWQYSSFHKFVKNDYYDINWCNFGDKNNIENLNLE